MPIAKVKNDKLGYNELLLRCECYDVSHIVSLGYFDDDDDKDGFGITVAFKMSHPWYKRLWVGLKYIFGQRDKWGLDTVSLNENDIDDIIDFMKEFKNGQKKEK